MSTAEELSILFSILHDGSIASAKGTEKHLTLRIECQYLAELFQPNFYFFYLELVGIAEFAFSAWEEPPLVTAGVSEALAAIIEADLEIAGATVQHNKTVIDCISTNPAASSAGGQLTISCQHIKLFDQEKRLLSSETLQQTAHRYWDQWKHKNP